MYHPLYKTKTIVILLFLLFLTISESFVVDEIVKQTSLPYRLLNWAKTLFPPDLNFRARVLTDDEPPPTEGGAGAGDKVKEAVVMSLGKGKASVEESAKSAADVTKEKMQQTAEKLKDTFSDSSHEL